MNLAVHTDHQAKELGPMTKRLQGQTDWVSTKIPVLLFSPGDEAYEIIHHMTDTVTQTDHPNSAAMLDNLPSTLWSCAAVDTPIWQRRYSPKPKAELGISETIEGPMRAGVTPVLPVGKHHMAHDLRLVNNGCSDPYINGSPAWTKQMHSSASP